MAKRTKTWTDHMVDASRYYAKTQVSLGKAIKSFITKKGFCKEAVELFGLDYTSGNETVITFDGEGEMCDLDITTAAGMTKDEIIENLSREVVRIILSE